MGKNKEERAFPDIKIINRGRRWLGDETHILIHSIHENQDVLSAKHESLGGSNQARLKTWNDIVYKLNASFNRGRNIKQCYGKFTDFMSKAKGKYGDLLVAYGSTGAGGIDRARNQMTPLELLALELKGIVGIQGLEVPSSVDPDSIDKGTGSFYNPPKSIDKQVVEETMEGSNEDASESSSEDEEEEIAPPALEAPKRFKLRSHSTGSYFKKKEGLRESSNKMMDADTTTRQDTSHVSRRKTLSTGKNSIKGNNVLLHELLSNQADMRNELDGLRNDMRSLLNHFGVQPTGAELGDKVPKKRKKGKVSSTITKEPDNIMVIESDAPVYEVDVEKEQSSLKSNEKNIAVSEGKKATSTGIDLPDPLLEIPHFGEAICTDEQNLDIVPIVIPTPNEEAQVGIKRNRKGKKGSTSKKQKVVEEPIPRVATKPTEKEKRVNFKSKKVDKTPTKSSTSTKTKKPFTMSQLKSAIHDQIRAMGEDEWNILIQTSRCSKAVFADYTSLAYKILGHLNDEEETEFCTYVMKLMPKTLTMFGQSRVVTIMVSKLVTMRIINVADAPKTKTTSTDEGHGKKQQDSTPEKSSPERAEELRSLMKKYLIETNQYIEPKDKTTDASEPSGETTANTTQESSVGSEQSPQPKRYPIRTNTKQ